jgi:hypothetical protein
MLILWWELICLLLFLLTCTTMFNYTDVVPKQQSYLYNINQQHEHFLNLFFNFSDIFHMF